MGGPGSGRKPSGKAKSKYFRNIEDVNKRFAEKLKASGMHHKKIKQLTTKGWTLTPRKTK